MTVIQQLCRDRMKIIMFFPLLLLVCSFSADETETAVQQPCPQDIHAVLRELTASLAVQNERITVLQRENQEQAAKLESQKIQTDKLTQQLQVKQVAFSASLLDQGNRETGPFNTQITLVFKRVVTNIGNAYNPHTGIFTAPVRGVYHFDWSLYGDGNLAAGGVLFRNGEHIFIAYEHQTSGGVSTSNGASLLLDVGDQVSVRLYTGARLNDSQNHHNTFSGHLIFTM
ncbi:complement C1q tumor necrosis factor-related protein 3-like [Maylandia zebra]|uniref:complement C1q tumor necrosis factor-related protein 3-like n=1 Tax=Maylandia zebra TaxID=106582 RepID=UPI00403CE7FE